jgi:tight adherence protein B
MLSLGVLLLLVFLLGATSIYCFLLAAFYRRIEAASPLSRRLALISAAGAAAKLQGIDASARKRSVEETLRESELQAKARAKSAKPSLTVRLRQAQLSWSKGKYYLICVGTGLSVLLVMLSTTALSWPTALGFGVSGGLLLPHAFVGFKRRSRIKRFVLELPNAVDSIVRGVKVGLPLVDCFKIVAGQTQEPVKTEFGLAIEDQTMGMPLADATERLPQRVPTPEARFFAIVIAIQSRTGGSVAEALTNLSTVLRERQKMRGKIKALSSESKASAMIIGSLPVFVAGALYVVSPNYISLLFTTQTGHLVLAACAVWMLIGSLVMRKMINFEV